MNFKDVRFIPAMKGAESCLGNIQEVCLLYLLRRIGSYSLSQVFSAPWAAVGFMVLQSPYEAYSIKLKIKDHPPASQLIHLLQTKPPNSETEAAELFRLLAGRVNGMSFNCTNARVFSMNVVDFKSSDLQRLASVSFVPVKSEKGAAGPLIRYLPPSQCYLAGQGDTSFHSKLFVFVDFGTGANSFLTACGTRSQPSVEEVAKILLTSPQQFYELAQGPAK